MKETRKYIKEAIKNLNTAEHMAFVVFPIINEKKFLLKVLERTNASIINSIHAAILLKNKKVLKNNKKNLENFNQLAKHYNITKEELKTTKEIFETTNNHKKSAIEFPKKDKVIIMMDNLRTIKLNFKKIKKYISIVRSINTKISKKLV